jgi:hypothetical protein
METVWSMVCTDSPGQRAPEAGYQSSPGPCELIFIPGLLNGLAGIGYQMRRRNLSEL